MSAPIKIVYNILSNNSALTALVSSRINPIRIPQESAFPAIAYNLVSVIASPTNTSHSRTDFARVQVSSFGTTFADVMDTAAEVRAAFESVNYPDTFNGVYCQAIEFDGEVHLAEDEAGFAGVYHIAQDFIINYNYAAPIPSGASFLLLESGSFMLLEDGYKIEL
jgi:hypothetical protein